MQQLMKPAEYAQKMGIARQAVYAKIKKGLLNSKSVDGKLYIVLEKSNNKKESPKTTDIYDLLEAKDETISVLKSTIDDLKESNEQITTTLRGEIDLLKEAFAEMRNLYDRRLQSNTKTPATLDVKALKKSTAEWVEMGEFLKSMGIKKSNRKEIKKRIKKALKKDNRHIRSKKGVLYIDRNGNFDQYFA